MKIDDVRGIFPLVQCNAIVDRYILFKLVIETMFPEMRIIFYFLLMEICNKLMDILQIKVTRQVKNIYFPVL
jgi:hypothetical protein